MPAATDGSAGTATQRDPARKERILLAAADLFARAGFQNVAMSDIGAAAGIVGSGVYRHFASKQAVLAALMDRILYLLYTSGRRIAAEAANPDAALNGLIDEHLAVALTQSAVFRVYLQELRSLADDDLRDVRRQQHEYLNIWVRILRERRPDSSEMECELRARAAIGVIHSVLYPDSTLKAAQLAELIAPMVRAVLEA